MGEKSSGVVEKRGIKVTPVKPIEYILVTDRHSKILLSSFDRFELIRLANKIRKAGGSVTIFKATKL